MAKVDKQMRLRNEGLARALEIIDREKDVESGVEMLRKEVKFRNAVPIPLEISNAKIRECNIMFADRIMNNMLIVVLRMMQEGYGFGRTRLQRFSKQFHAYCDGFLSEDPYGERYVNISDYAKYFKEEFGIEFGTEVMEEIISVEKQNKELRQRKVAFERIEKLLVNGYPEALEHLRKSLQMK